jgi:tetratricopeptide (TPR) repeat protein
LPAPGNFDRWLDDPQGPSAVNLAELDDLIAKQNHILKVAFESLGPEERQLLGIFAFFSQAITGDVLLDLNPQRLPRPKEVKRPKPVDEEGDIALWMLQQRLRDAAAPKVKSTIKRELLRRRAELNEQFARQSEAYRQYEIALTQWRTSPELRDADGWLRTAVADLQKRGLLMRDRATARYDLHPMVRGFVRHALKSSESANIGRTVADYARSRSVPQYERASSLADLAQGIQIVIALTLGRHYEDAAEALEGNLSMALVRLELFTEWQALLQPLFSQGWDNLPDRVAEGERGSFAGNAAICFERLGDYKRAEVLYQLAIARWIADDSLYGTAVWIRNYAGFVESMGSLARSARLLDLHGPAAEASGSELQIGWHKVHLASKNLKCGALAAARQTLDELAAEVAARKYDSSLEAEILRFETLLLEKEGGLLEATVDRALEEARLRAERYDERILHYRRGKLLQSLGDHGRAIDAFEKSIAMAREVYAQAGNVEAKCAVSLAALRRRDEALDIARRIDVGDDLPHVELAELYLALDDKTKAYQHALAGYRRAWADGPPFAFHWDLEDCRKVLKALGECEPQCPPFDPARVQTFDFEPDLHRLLEKKAERVKEKRRKSGRKQRSLGRAS